MLCFIWSLVFKRQERVRERKHYLININNYSILLSVPSQAMSVSENASLQSPGKSSHKWNAAKINGINSKRVFPALISQNVYREKGLLEYFINKTKLECLLWCFWVPLILDWIILNISEWNAAIIDVINSNCVFPALTSQNVAIFGRCLTMKTAVDSHDSPLFTTYSPQRIILNYLFQQFTPDTCIYTVIQE